MIHGIGCDIANIKRIDKVFKRFGSKFVKKICSSKEITFFSKIIPEDKKILYLAKVFCGKEAFAKSMGTGLGSYFAFEDLSISNNILGKPGLELSEKLLNYFDSIYHRKEIRSHISFSYEKEYIISNCVIEIL